MFIHIYILLYSIHAGLISALQTEQNLYFLSIPFKIDRNLVKPVENLFYNDTLAIHWTSFGMLLMLNSLLFLTSLILIFEVFNFACMLAWLSGLHKYVRSDSIPFQSLHFQILYREFPFCSHCIYDEKWMHRNCVIRIIVFILQHLIFFLEFSSSSNSNDICVAIYYLLHLLCYCDSFVLYMFEIILISIQHFALPFEYISFCEDALYLLCSLCLFNCLSRVRSVSN